MLQVVGSRHNPHHQKNHLSLGSQSYSQVHPLEVQLEAGFHVLFQQQQHYLCFNDSMLLRFFWLPQVFHFFIFFLGGTRKKYKKVENLRLQEESLQQRIISAKQNLAAAEAKLENRRCSQVLKDVWIPSFLTKKKKLCIS